jgi:putative hemolysin
MIASLAGLLTLLFLSAFFSSSETAFTSLSLMQIEHIKSRHPRRGGIVEGLHQHPDRLLTTILIGNNLVNIAISVISSELTIRMFGNAALGVTTGVLTMAILIFGEVIPKQFAIRNNEWICLQTGSIIRFLSFVFLPIILFINAFSRLLSSFGRKKNRDYFTLDGILHMVKHAENIGILENYKSRMVKSVFRFSDVTVHAIMTHRKDVFSLNRETRIEKALPLIAEQGHSRIPVYEDHPENIVGVVLEKDLMRLSARGDISGELGDVMLPAVYIPETWKIHRVFRKLKEEVLNMAIILDEYGGLAGIVTMEDLVEEIIGEIYDEDEEPDAAKILKSAQEGWYTIQGDTPIYVLEDVIGVKIEHDRNSETVGGYVLEQLSGLPVKGQKIETGIGTFVIQAMSSKAVQIMKYRPVSPADGGDSAPGS